MRNWPSRQATWNRSASHGELLHHSFQKTQRQENTWTPRLHHDSHMSRAQRRFGAFARAQNANCVVAPAGNFKAPLKVAARPAGQHSKFNIFTGSQNSVCHFRDSTVTSACDDNRLPSFAPILASLTPSLCSLVNSQLNAPKCVASSEAIPAHASRVAPPADVGLTMISGNMGVISE